MDQVLVVFKTLLEFMPYDPRVYALYFVNKMLYSLFPWKRSTSGREKFCDCSPVLNKVVLFK